MIRAPGRQAPVLSTPPVCAIGNVVMRYEHNETDSSRFRD